LEASAENISRMGCAAQQRVLQRHNIDREAAKLEVLFENSIGRKHE
jgi:hypothetical protein